VSEALLIIDFQNDFTPGGALGVEGGDEIAGRLNELASDPRFELVAATRDWHPSDHGSFKEQGGVWPVHCVQGTLGAELHRGLDRSRIDVVVDKGQAREADGYSGFEATLLEELLRAHGVDQVTIGGIATDYCVKNTALDALRLGFGVTIDRDAVRGVEVEPGDSDRALDEIRAAGGLVPELS
jgi:nicotinamidase/pyrazinamidase